MGLLGQGEVPAILPDQRVLPRHVVKAFLQEAPRIAEQLAVDFPRATCLLKSPGHQLQEILASGSLSGMPELGWAKEIRGIEALAQETWRNLWEACWHQAEGEHLARLFAVLRSGRLLVTPVARPQDSTQMALRLLWDCLLQDTRRGWDNPPAEMYLYDEPLEDWLVRPLLSGQWLLRLCQVLVELTHQVSVSLEKWNEAIVEGALFDAVSAAWEQCAGLGPPFPPCVIAADPTCSVSRTYRPEYTLLCSSIFFGLGGGPRTCS